jgi:AcrR family transcriptional regulator
MTVSVDPSGEMRGRILSSGRRLLAEKGLRALTTNAIAERVRISKKTLYRCFPTKDDLVEAILVSFIEENLTRWDAALSDDSLPAMERIGRSLDYVSQFLPMMQTLVLNQVEPESVTPELWAKIDAIRLSRLARFRLLIEEAQAESYLRSDVHPEHWMLLLVGAVQTVLTPSVLLERGIPLPDIVRTVRTIFYDGLLTDKGRRYVKERRKEDA